jgi:uncharacterized protein (TIGR03032 family)
MDMTAGVLSNVHVDDDLGKEAEGLFDFSSTYTENFPKILAALNISLAVTSYQSSRLILIRNSDDGLHTHFKEFPQPMGVYADRNRLTIGTLDQVIEFKRSDTLLDQIKQGYMDVSEKLPRKLVEKNEQMAAEMLRQKEAQVETLKLADSLYLQRASLTTGMINIHDIAWGKRGLWVVNSTFSCLATLTPDHNFVAQWHPPFITELLPEDRCHLNGMAMQDGEPRYVTTFSKGNLMDAWTEIEDFDGTLIDVRHNEILLDDLIMPHSPRYHGGFVYYCNSGTGEVHRYDLENGERRVLFELPGFTRGLHIIGELMFVGLSRVRSSSAERMRSPLHSRFGPENSKSGVWLFDLRTETEIAHLSFSGNVEQLYDIAIIPEGHWPELVQQGDILIRHIYEFKQADRPTVEGR